MFHLPIHRLMNTCKVITDFSKNKFKDSNLAVKCRYVVREMTDNPNFPNPSPSLNELSLAIEAFEKSLQTFNGDMKLNTAIKNNLRKKLEDLMQQMAGYVQQIGRYNEAVVLSAGMDIRRKNEKVGKLSRAEGLSVKPGANKGCVEVSCDRIEHSRFYEFEYCAAPATPDSVWMKQTSTRRKMQIGDLTSGKEYVFRVAGAGTSPSRIWSNEVKSYVL